MIRPLLAQKDVPPAARVVLGTVQGDLHDIGKNLVGAMLEGGGFEVIDLGVNVAPAMKKTLEVFRTAGIRGRVKVMIGGAPITQSYADSIGADAFGQNAGAAVAIARKLAGR